MTAGKNPRTHMQTIRRAIKKKNRAKRPLTNGRRAVPVARGPCKETATAVARRTGPDRSMEHDHHRIGSLTLSVLRKRRSILCLEAPADAGQPAAGWRGGGTRAGCPVYRFACLLRARTLRCV
jgi:hypothetical protein